MAAVARDWMSALADAIQRDYGVDTSAESARPSLVALIAKHCPFRTDVAYMPVPRCDGCAQWTPSTQECAELREGKIFSRIFTAPDFGCVRWSPR